MATHEHELVDCYLTITISGIYEIQVQVQAAIHQVEAASQKAAFDAEVASQKAAFDVGLAEAHTQLYKFQERIQIECAALQSTFEAVLRQQAAAATSQVRPLYRDCNGLRSEYVKPILGFGIGPYYGNLAIEYLFRALQIQCNENGEQLPWRSAQAFEYQQPEQHAALKQLFGNAPLYQSNEKSIQSVLCLHQSLSGTCAMCVALGQNRCVQKRVLKIASADGGREPSKYTRHDRVSAAAVMLRLRQGCGKIVRLFHAKDHCEVALKAANRRADRLVEKAKYAITRDNAPKYLRNFIEAHELGVLSPAGVQELLDDMGAGLTANRLRRNQTTRSLYISLLNNGSPWVASLVSRNLMGPHMSTIKRWRGTESFSYEPKIEFVT